MGIRHLPGRPLDERVRILEENGLRVEIIHIMVSSKENYNFIWDFLNQDYLPPELAVMAEEPDPTSEYYRFRIEQLNKLFELFCELPYDKVKGKSI
jgi:hypothetical protein